MRVAFAVAEVSEQDDARLGITAAQLGSGFR